MSTSQLFNLLGSVPCLQNGNNKPVVPQYCFVAVLCKLYECYFLLTALIKLWLLL
jgi:hypothetical protein